MVNEKPRFNPVFQRFPETPLLVGGAEGIFKITKQMEKNMTDLSLLEEIQLDAPAIFLQKEGDKLIASVNELVADLPKDAETEENRALLRTAAAKISSLKNRVDEAGKGMTEEWQRQTKDVNKERNRIWDILEGIQKAVRAPLTKYEEDKKAKEIEADSNIVKLNTIIHGNHVATDVKTLETLLEGVRGTTYYFGDRETEGANAKNLAITTLDQAIVDRKKYDAEQAELAEFRAQKDAQAQKDAAAAEEKRIADLAEQKKKDDADREAAEQQRLAKDKTHKAKIHNDAINAMVAETGVTADLAKAIITAIVKGKVPNVKITY